MYLLWCQKLTEHVRFQLVISISQDQVHIRAGAWCVFCSQLIIIIALFYSAFSVNSSHKKHCLSLCGAKYGNLLYTSYQKECGISWEDQIFQSHKSSTLKSSIYAHFSGTFLKTEHEKWNRKVIAPLFVQIKIMLSHVRVISWNIANKDPITSLTSQNQV